MPKYRTNANARRDNCRDQAFALVDAAMSVIDSMTMSAPVPEQTLDAQSRRYAISERLLPSLNVQFWKTEDS